MVAGSTTFLPERYSHQSSLIDYFWYVKMFWLCLFFFFFLVVAPIVLIGNKTDLQMDLQTIIRLDKMNQELTRIEDGFTMAEEIGAYTYLECSAWMNVRVREVFETATRAFFERESKPSIVQ